MQPLPYMPVGGGGRLRDARPSYGFGPVPVVVVTVLHRISTHDDDHVATLRCAEGSSRSAQVPETEV